MNINFSNEYIRRLGTIKPKTLKTFKKMYDMRMSGKYSNAEIADILGGYNIKYVSDCIRRYTDWNKCNLNNLFAVLEPTLEEILECNSHTIKILSKNGFNTLDSIYILFAHNTAKLCYMEGLGLNGITQVAHGLVSNGYDLNVKEVCYIYDKFPRYACTRSMSTAYFETLKTFPMVVKRVRTEKDLLRSIKLNPLCVNHIPNKLITDPIEKVIYEINKKNIGGVEKMEERNLKMYKLFKEGVPTKDMCEMFNLSDSRINGLLREMSTDGELDTRVNTGEASPEEVLYHALEKDRSLYNKIRRHGIHDLDTLKNYIENHTHLLCDMNGMAKYGFSKLLKRLGYYKEHDHLCKIYTEYTTPNNSIAYQCNSADVCRRPKTIELFYRKKDIIDCISKYPRSIKHVDKRLVDKEICTILKKADTDGRYYELIKPLHTKLKKIK